MPSYKVLERGFYDGKTYDPKGKRRQLHVDKPFKKCPSWLEPIKPETAAQKKKRLAAEAAEQKKVDDDQQDIDNASFMGDGESNVESL